MMPAGPPASASAATTGKDGIFSAHLAAASQGQVATAQQTSRANNQENTHSNNEQVTDVADVTAVQPKDVLDSKETGNDNGGNANAPGYNFALELKELLNTRETGNDNTGKATAPGYNFALELKERLNTRETGNDNTGKPLTSASDNKTNKDDTPTNDLTSDTTLNGSAGAANAGIILLHWTGADIKFSPNDQAIAKTQNNESIIARMLDAITSAANGTTGAPRTDSPTNSAQAGATVIVPTKPATQAFSVEAKQPQAPTTDSLASPDNTAVITVPVVSINEKNGAARMIDNSSLQPQITVSLVSDATLAAKSVSLTEQTTIVSPSATAQTQSSAIQTPAQQSQAQPSANQVIQNKYGQIITIYQSNESQEIAAATSVDSKPLSSVTNNQKMDANSNFTQAHLVNDAPKAPENESGSQQQDTTAKDNQQKDTNTAKTFTNGQPQSEQFTPLTSPLTVDTGDQPFTFSHQPTGTPLASTPLADSSMRLPSGFIVPGETVVDQMISRFSVNNRLESGTVNLKLHPQELGELRMEIKITQDNIKAHIVAQTPQAQEMISQHLPRLREALEQQGLHLQQIEVTIAANDNAGREQFQGHAGQQQLNQFMHNSRGNQPIFTLETGDETGEATQITNNLSVMA
jgi:flagellar hook-length control protein FliK